MTVNPKWFVKLYPAAWRARYGDELNGLLDDAKTSPRDYADLLATALRLQLTTWSIGRIAVASCSAGLLAMLVVAAYNLTAPTYYMSEATFLLRPATPATRQYAETFKEYLISSGTLATLLRNGKISGERSGNASIDERVASVASRIDIAPGTWRSESTLPQDNWEATELMIVVKDEDPFVALSIDRAITDAVLAEDHAPSTVQPVMKPMILPKPQEHVPWHELAIVSGILVAVIAALLLGVFWLFLTVVRRRLRSA